MKTSMVYAVALVLLCGSLVHSEEIRDQIAQVDRVLVLPDVGDNPAYFIYIHTDADHWFAYPLDYTLAVLLDAFAGWAIVGVVQAGIVRPVTSGARAA